MKKVREQEKTEYAIEDLYLNMFAQYDDIVTVEEAASMLRLDKKRVYRMIRSGELISIHFDRTIRLTKAEIIKYVHKCGFILQEKMHKQRQAEVTVFCQSPKSRKQIQEFLDLADRKFFRDSVLHPLLEDGILAMTIPENPSDIKQRYIATTRLKRENIPEDLL